MIDEIATGAEQVVEGFIQQHHAAAIPALIGACVMWAVENGGAELIKGTLGRSIELADQMEAIRREQQQ